jgi:hypothetical protein
MAKEIRPRITEQEYELILKYRKGEDPKGGYSFKQNGDHAEYSFNTSHRIKTLADLIDACEIDLGEWEIERWVCNKWDVGMKMAAIGGTKEGWRRKSDEVVVTPLFQVKVWLKPVSVKDPIKAVREMVEEMKQYSIKYAKNTDPHLLVIDPADIHIGKLCRAFETGEDYNSQIAVKRVKDGVNGILGKVQGYNIDKVLLIIGNDILHIDTPKRTTTAGTPQDTDGMWYDNFRIAKRLYIDIIELLMQIAPVHIQYDPSNHDYTNGFFLADTISSWFERCESVTFNVSPAHRKYFTYGKNLIGTTHNDGAKETDLALLMAHEAAENWNSCKHRYVYTHHIHHKKSKDYMSVCVESLRSPSGTDSWHHRNGYQHSPKAIEGYLHHPEHGQVSRITHLF